jgi:hypothetical protein
MAQTNELRMISFFRVPGSCDVWTKPWRGGLTKNELANRDAAPASINLCGVIQGTSGVIQGTSGVIQGTFGFIQVTLGVIRGTFEVCEGTFEVTKVVQGNAVAPTHAHVFGGGALLCRVVETHWDELRKGFLKGYICYE